MKIIIKKQDNLYCAEMNNGFVCIEEYGNSRDEALGALVRELVRDGHYREWLNLTIEDIDGKKRIRGVDLMS